MAQQNDPGLGSKYSKQVKRLINEDGSYNIVRRGGIHGFKDFYKFLIDIPWLPFMSLLLLAYLIINVFFACLYLLSGIENLNGIDASVHPFFHAFFFSVQTFTTVGYGGISPLGLAANLIATFEAFIGLLAFAIATGLLYGRFSKPSSKIRFSKNIILTPFEATTALMFKMVNIRNTILLNSKVEALLILDSAKKSNRYDKLYYKLELETDFINFFPLTWTVVHKISEKSPIYNLSLAELKQRNAEVVILVESFDEVFSQTIFTKHSFAGEQWVENVKFVKNYDITDDGAIILHVNQIDEIEKI